MGRSAALADTTSTDAALLSALLRRLGLPETLSSLVLAHAAAVKRDGARLGLVSPGDLGLVVPRHSADSLLFAFALAPQPGERWVDAGSGAGFPGMVLACCYPATTFALVEPMRRRAGFLESTASALGLDNVEVHPMRLEQAGQFTVGVARAYADPHVTIGQLLDHAERALVAAGSDAAIPPGVVERRVQEMGLESPGRLFMAKRTVR